MIKQNTNLEQFLSVYVKLLETLTIFQNSLLSYSWVINQFANKISALYMMLGMFLWCLQVNKLQLWKLCTYTILKWRTLCLQNFVSFLRTSCINQSTKHSYTECMFYHSPEHCSYHGMSWPVQPTSAIKLLWSGEWQKKHSILFKNVTCVSGMSVLL